VFSKIKLLKNKLVSEQIYEGRPEQKSVWRVSEAPTPTVTTSSSRDYHLLAAVKLSHGSRRFKVDREVETVVRDGC
jgi:hypothetical protein